MFGEAWDQGDLGDAMLRSLVVTIVITGAQLVTSVLAAYAFAFLHFPFKRLVFALFMATLLLPLEVTLLANVTLDPPAATGSTRCRRWSCRSAPPRSAPS